VLTRAETEFKAGYTQVFLLGVDAAGIGQVFPELDQIVAPLKDKQVDLLPGIKLPEDAKRLQISAQVPEQSTSQFRGATLNRPESLNILVTLNDTYGSQASLTLSGTLTPGAWAVFGADVPPAPAGRGPWSISRVQLAPYAQKVQWIGREIRLDTLQTLDANGKSTLLEDFEQDGSDWAPAARGFFRSELDAATAASGKRSLRVEFGVQRLANDPDPGLDDAARQAAQIKAFQTVDLSVAGVRQVAVPVVISARMAREEGRANRPDRMPLQAGDEGTLDLDFTGGKATLRYRVAGITRSFPSFQDDQYFLVLNARNVGQIVNPVVPSERQVGPNQVWLRLPDRQPGAGLNSALNRLPGVVPDSAVFAWDRYNQLLREPPCRHRRMLSRDPRYCWPAGFFYLAVTVKRRSVGFAVLQALGWNARSLWTLLAAEQAALVIPALLIGILLGAAMAYVILPFLALIGGQTLSISAANLAALFVALIIGFGVISVGAAWWLRRMSVNQVLRLGEE
jgi:hypothetical protein